MRYEYPYHNRAFKAKARTLDFFVYEYFVFGAGSPAPFLFSDGYITGDTALRFSFNDKEKYLF